MKKQKKNKTIKLFINKDLERFRGTILFPEKLKKANEILERVGIPELEQDNFSQS